MTRPLRLFACLLMATTARARSANQPPPLPSDLVDVSRDFRDYTNAWRPATGGR